MTARSSASFASWRVSGSSGRAWAPVGSWALAVDPEITSRTVDVDEMLVRPGTYFNPQTEVVVVVDDSASIDQEVFNMEAYEGAEWVRLSDEVPVDEDGRDRVLEAFQTHYHPGLDGSLSETALELDDPEENEGEDGQEPGRED